MRLIVSALTIAAISVVAGCEGAVSETPAASDDANFGAPEPPAPAAPGDATGAAPADAGAAATPPTSLPTATTSAPAGTAPASAQTPTAPMPTDTASSPASAATTSEAQVGVGTKGQDYGGPGIVTTPVETYFRTLDRLAFEVQIPNAMKIYKAGHDNKGPATHEEFMNVIIKENGVQLPELPQGEEYFYDPATEKLMIRHPAK